tara:strand:- start:251 stop:433 length:183 start_codon:yes stop_codon:yes gene_type:complete
MTVFWVLAWSKYYPYGGLGNVHSQHETLDEALEIAKQLEATNEYDHVEVEDVSEMLGVTT